MKIWHISDTHGWHDNLTIPDDIDVLIHSGDAANLRDIHQNCGEFFLFIEWLEKIRSKFKHIIFTPGNHDTYCEKNEKQVRRLFSEIDVHILINEAIELDGVKFWGSPLTPTFHDWAYGRDRGKIQKAWRKIPDDTEVLITHGPPKGILDLTENHKYQLEQVGSSALRSRINQLKSLKLCLSGHIHTGKNTENQGVLIRNGIVYSNASCVTDGAIDFGLTSSGNTFSLINGKVSLI